MEASYNSGLYYAVIFSILLVPCIHGQYYLTSGKLQSLFRLINEKQSLSTLKALLSSSLAIDDKKYSTQLEDNDDNLINKPKISTNFEVFNEDDDDTNRKSSTSFEVDDSVMVHKTRPKLPYFEDDDNNMINKPYKGGKYSNYHEKNVPMYSGEYDNSVQSSDGVSYEDKRSSEEEYSDGAVVDILVIVDNSIYKNYLKKHNYNHKKAIRSIKRYYTLLINLIDARYKEVDLVYPIRIRPASVMIIEDKSEFDWSPTDYHDWKNEKGLTEYVLEPHRALKDLQQWLKHKHDLPSYDHAMTFTGKTLVKENQVHASSGMAYISTICQTDNGYSTSIIGESGGFGNVETASHELGHSLGARHDGNRGNEGCPAELGYIMAPSVSLRENYEHNYFTFSSCSIKAFNEMLKSEQASCLFNSKAVSKPNKLPGQWMTPDKQCKHVFGSSSGECKMSQTEEICQMLWCKDPNDRYGCITKTGLHAVYGSSCAKGKICYNGQCVEERGISPYHKYMTKSHHRGNKKPTQLENYNDDKSMDKTDNPNKPIDNEDILDDGVYTEEQTDYNEEKLDLVIPKNEIINIDSIFDQSSKVKNPTPGEKIYLARKVKNPHKPRGREKVRGKYHKVSTTTTTPRPTTTTTTTTTTSRPVTCRDKNSRYCITTIYPNGEHACSVPHIASYCCYSCSYYRR